MLPDESVIGVGWPFLNLKRLGGVEGFEMARGGKMRGRNLEMAGLFGWLGLEMLKYRAFLNRAG
jgi:hypothetical protein